MKRTLLTAAALLCAAAPAGAQDPGLGQVTSARADLASARPGVASELTLRVTGAPSSTAAPIAPAIRQTVDLPRGSRIRLGAVVPCRATPAEITRAGAQAACPPASRIGEGLAVGLLNGNEVRFELGVYAVPGGLVFAAGTQSFRATVSGTRRLTFDVPTAGGTLVPTLFEARLPGFIRTPPSCPPDRRWRSRYAFQALTAADGTPFGPVQALDATSRCQRAPAPRSRSHAATRSDA